MKTFITKVEESVETFIVLPEELGFHPGDQFSIEYQDSGVLILKPYKSIEIDIDDSIFLQLAKEAHERNITFNDLCIEILQNETKKIGEKDAI